MGRNKTELTQEEIERRILRGQRISKYRENSIDRLTQAELSEKLDIQE